MSVDVHKLQNRTLSVLVSGQLLTGAGISAGIVVGALLAEDLFNSTSAAGVPATVFTIGSAGAALLVGMISQRSGRRVGLAAGYLASALGAAGVVLAAELESIPLFVFSLLFYGAAFSTNLQARYAGADLARPEARATAVSIVLVATTVGAVIAPNLVEQTGDLAAQLDLPRLAGPFLLSAAVLSLASLVLTIFLRPDPLLTARKLALDAPAADGGDDEGDRRGVRVAVAVMVVTQLVMVAIMTMTPIHMRDHGHSLSDTGMVISLHIAAMFLPSPITGIAVDKFGRRPMIAASGVVLLAAGLLAAATPADSMVLLSVALVLLGLGWNFGLIAGTALITDSVPLATRATTQGRADLLIALAGSTGGLGSGLIVAGTSYSTLGLLGGVAALAMIPLLFAAPKPNYS